MANFWGTSEIIELCHQEDWYQEISTLFPDIMLTSLSSALSFFSEILNELNTCSFKDSEKKYQLFIKLILTNNSIVMEQLPFAFHMDVCSTYMERDCILQIPPLFFWATVVHASTENQNWLVMWAVLACIFLIWEKLQILSICLGINDNAIHNNKTLIKQYSSPFNNIRESHQIPKHGLKIYIYSLN